MLSRVAASGYLGSDPLFKFFGITKIDQFCILIQFFCFIFFIWSVALIGLGTVKTSAFSFLVTDAIQVGALVFGIILLTVSTLGCWGAWKQYRMLIITFAVLVGLQIVCEMAVGGIFLSRRGKVLIWTLLLFPFFLF
jgi:hypothetical protein